MLINVHAIWDLLCGIVLIALTITHLSLDTITTIIIINLKIQILIVIFSNIYSNNVVNNGLYDSMIIIS